MYIKTGRLGTHPENTRGQDFQTGCAAEAASRNLRRRGLATTLERRSNGIQISNGGLVVFTVGPPKNVMLFLVSL